MNIEYFNDKIKDELCGAKDYIMKAIELKPMNKSWSEWLFERMKNEKTHADTLYKMSVEYYKKIGESYNNMPQYIVEAMEDITKNYTESIPLLSSLYMSYKE